MQHRHGPGAGSGCGIIKVTSNIRLMVVEDYAPLRAALTELLIAWGYNVEAASDGPEALEKIRCFTPAIVVCDVDMLDGGAMELLKTLRWRAPATRCIIMAAEVGEETAIEAIRLGAFSFLEKPVGAERLRMELQACVDQAAAFDSSAG
jgi:DNA-binding NtrC family response regulator